MAQLNRFWRLLATGFCFLSFGLGGGLIGLLIAPTLMLWPKVDRAKLGKKLIKLGFRLFIEQMRFCGVLSYQIDNPERLLEIQGELVLANHPSLIDVIFLLAFTNQPDCIVKQSLLHNPFTIGPVSAARFITNNSETLLEQAKKSLAEGNNLVLFPEGTRTKPGRVMQFQRGAANIALQSNCIVRPVIIQCCPTTLTKGEPWYSIPKRRVHVTLCVKEPIEIGRYRRMPRIQGARLLTQDLETYFQKEVNL